MQENWTWSLWLVQFHVSDSGYQTAAQIWWWNSLSKWGPASYGRKAEIFFLNQKITPETTSTVVKKICTANSLKVSKIFLERNVNQEYPLAISQTFRGRGNLLASSLRVEKTMSSFPSACSHRPTAVSIHPIHNSYSNPLVCPQRCLCPPAIAGGGGVGRDGQGVNSQRVELRSREVIGDPLSWV